MRLIVGVCLGASALGVGCGDEALVVGGSLPEPSAEVPDASGADPAMPGCDTELPGECDLVTGCGCPSGQTCRIDVSRGGAGACNTLAAEPLAPYSVCTSGDQCPPVHSCVQFMCKKQCREAEDCGWDGARCVAPLDENGAALTGGYCTKPCDVAAPQAPDPGFAPCPEGVRCSAFGDGTDCAGALGSTAEWEACSSYGQCAAGLYCSVEGRCQRYCKMGGDDCGSSARCYSAVPPLVVAGQEIGTCDCRPPPGEVCDMGLGCGCEAGTSCAWLGDAIGCRSVADAATAGTACTADLDCPRLHACLGGSCIRQCVVAEDCGLAGAECLPVTGADGEPISGFNYCTSACDPISPQAPRTGRQPCASGAQCYPYGNGPLCLASAGTPEGAACAGLLDCVPGTFCNARGVCQSWCEVGSDDCGTGRTCRGYDTPFLSSVPDLEPIEVGACLCAPQNGSACDPRNDCGCEDAGTCDFFIDPARFACRVLSEFPLPPHAACESRADCPALHTCIGGACKRVCVDAADCTTPGSRCLAVSDDPSLEGYRYCSISCDPVSPSAPRAGFEACPAGSQCLAGSLGADCAASAGTSAEGEACNTATDCAGGLLCGRGNVCQAFCEIGASSCSADLSCQAFDFPLRSAGRDFGRCVCPATSGIGCDLATDCGCDPGTTCTLSSLDPPSAECVPVATNPVQPYALCDSTDACPVLHTCIRGVCAERCVDTADCDGAPCIALGDSLVPPIPGLNVCSRNCDPVSPSAPRAGLGACGAGAQCLPFETGSECAFAGSTPLRGPCDDSADCLPGLFCDGLQCLAWCNVAAGECSAPEVCTEFSPPLIVGENNWGLCL